MSAAWLFVYDRTSRRDRVSVTLGQVGRNGSNVIVEQLDFGKFDCHPFGGTSTAN